jgi:hypothetical protein
MANASLVDLQSFARDYKKITEFPSGTHIQRKNISMDERTVPTEDAIKTLYTRITFGGVGETADPTPWNFDGIHDHAVDRFQVDYLGYATIGMLAAFYDTVRNNASHNIASHNIDIGSKEKADRVCYAFGLWGFSNEKHNRGPNGGLLYAPSDIVYLFLCRPPLSSVQPITRQNSVGGGGCSQWIMTRRKVTQQGVQRAVWRNKVTAKLATKRMVTQSGSAHRTASFVPL